MALESAPGAHPVDDRRGLLARALEREQAVESAMHGPIETLGSFQRRVIRVLNTAPNGAGGIEGPIPTSKTAASIIRNVVDLKERSRAGTFR